MRILYLHQYFNTPKESGGTRSYEMARRLVKAGHQVTLLTSSAHLHPFRAHAAGWHSDELAGIRIEALRVLYGNEMSFWQRIKAFMKFAFSAAWHVRKFKADVIFATSTPLTIIIPALAAKLWHRIPLVFEVRDLWPELPIAVGALRNPLAKMAARWLEWVAYHASVHVVALSPGMAAGVLRRGIPASKVTIIPNGCDVNLFDVPAKKGDWVRERLGLESGQPLIIYTGTFGLINGVGYLVDVAAAMRTIAPEVCFLLVGCGAEVDMVTAQAKRAGVLNSNLWIWPPLPKVQVPELLAVATMATSVVIPLKAIWNNSANKFFDALAAGKPIAINHEGWQADLIYEHKCGVVLPPDDPAAAARLLLDFIRDPKRLNRASVASRRLALEVFNRDLQYAKLEMILRDVVGRNIKD